MSYHGIPIRLVPDNPETHEPESNFETVVFSTVRRTPELQAHLNEATRLDIAEDGARARVILARRALLDAETPEEIDAAEATTQTAAGKLNEITADLAGTVHSFLLCGFKGAGYDDEAAERYAAMVPPERVNELKVAALLGSGRLDFTKAPAAA